MAGGPSHWQTTVEAGWAITAAGGVIASRSNCWAKSEAGDDAATAAIGAKFDSDPIANKVKAMMAAFRRTRPVARGVMVTSS
jgi:hypothetical protein